MSLSCCPKHPFQSEVVQAWLSSVGTHSISDHTHTQYVVMALQTLIYWWLNIVSRQTVCRMHDTP